MANKSTFVIIIGMLFRRNIPFYRPSILTLRTLYNLFFGSLRTFLLMFSIVEILPAYVISLELSVTLLSTNWWHSSSDPFITNASYLNAGICWILWIGIFFQIVNYVVWILAYFVAAPILMARMGFCKFMRE